MNNSWISIKEQWPPETELLVKDAQGNEAIATPTYYPFEVVKKSGDERKPYGWRGTLTPYEDGANKWDGGWMIDVSDDWTKEIGEITHWKAIAP